MNSKELSYYLERNNKRMSKELSFCLEPSNLVLLLQLAYLLNNRFDNSPNLAWGVQKPIIDFMEDRLKPIEFYYMLWYAFILLKNEQLREH